MVSSLVWEETAGLVYTGRFFFISLCPLINFSSSLCSRILGVYKELNRFDTSVVFLSSSLISI